MGEREDLTVGPTPDRGASGITRDHALAGNLANDWACCLLVVTLACAISVSACAGNPRVPDKVVGPPNNEQAPKEQAKKEQAKKEQVRAAAPAGIPLDTGSSVGWPPSAAMVLKLTTLPDAALPKAPGCSPPDPASFAGFIRFEQMPSAGKYEITVTPDAWIDIVQDDDYVPPVAVSGAPACPGLRKSGQFELRSSAVVLQLTGASSDHVVVTVTRIPMETAGTSLAQGGSEPAGTMGDAGAAKPDATAAASTAVAAPPPAPRELPQLPSRDISRQPAYVVDESSTPPARPVDLRDNRKLAAARPANKPARQLVEPAGLSSARAPASPSASANDLARTTTPAKQDPTAAAVAPTHHQTSEAPTAPAAASAAPTPAAASPANASDLTASLLRRGDEFLKMRDVAAARLLYERAAKAGSARGAMLVGKTYDPLYFAEISAHGIAADRAKAIEWYDKAIGLGDDEAAARAAKLRAGAQQ